MRGGDRRLLLALRRALGAEAGEIRKGAGASKQLIKLARMRAFDAEKRRLEEKKGASGFSVSSESLEYKQQLLSAAIEEVDKHAALSSSKPWLVRLGRIFHEEPDDFYLRCSVAAADNNRTQLSKLLREQQERVNRSLVEVRAMEEAEREMERSSLPPEPVLNNILRYETAIERRLDKAIARLDLLQQRRRAAEAAARQQARQ